jgi:hypothetical protein
MRKPRIYIHNYRGRRWFMTACSRPHPDDKVTNCYLPGAAMNWISILLFKCTPDDLRFTKC